MAIMLIEILINFYQGFLIIYFCDNFFSVRKITLAKTISIMAIGSFLCIHQFLSLPITDTLVFLFGLIYLFITKRGTIIGRILCTVLLAAIWISSVTILNAFISSVFNIDFEQALQNDAGRILYLVSFNVFITFLIFVICKVIHQDQHAVMPMKYTLFFVTLLLTELFASELLFAFITQSNITSVSAFYCVFSLFVIVIMTIILYEVFCYVLSNAIASENKSRMLIDSKLHQTDITSMYQALLKDQHDLKHKINAIEALLSQCSPDVYTAGNSLLKSSSFDSNAFLTGNITMDAILTAKREIAQNNNIEFRYQPYPLSNLPIDEISFCVLISNLLDNAIQAEMQMPENASTRYVELKFSRNLDMFSILCLNPIYEQQKIISEDLIKTRKKTGHGYGLESIKHTTEANQGICHITSGNYIFCVEILLPMQEKT